MTLYDPDDPNQSLYKSNMRPAKKLIRLILKGYLPDGRTIEQTIADPKGICLQRYYQARQAMMKAFSTVHYEEIFT